MLATFVSNAQDNVVEELPSAEQRSLLHLRLEVDWEPEILHHYHVIVLSFKDNLHYQEHRQDNSVNKSTFPSRVCHW